MPTPALDKIQLLTADGITQVGYPHYTGRWVAHLPAITSPPGDGLINEVDFTVALPGHPGFYVGFFIGNDSDGDPSRFASDQVLDTASLPAWVTFFGTFIADAAGWGEPLSIVTWDGTWTDFAITPTTFITIDTANSDPAWDGITGPRVDSYSPSSAHSGDTVSIIGSGLVSADSVTVAGWGATTTPVDDTQVDIVVPFGPPYGPAAVQVHLAVDGSLVGSWERLELLAAPPPPTIDSLTPARTHRGETVTAVGSGFTGITDLTFDGASIGFTFVDDSHVTFVVPITAIFGHTTPVTITTPVGTSSANYVLVGWPPPTITSVSPAITTSLMAAATDTDGVLTITGDNFSTDVSPTVRLGPLALSLLTVTSTVIQAYALASGDDGFVGEVTPAADITATVTVATPDGSATSVDEATVIPALYAQLETVGPQVIASGSGIGYFRAFSYFVPLDATHVLSWGMDGMYVVDYSDPTALTVGTGVNLLNAVYNSVPGTDPTAWSIWSNYPTTPAVSYDIYDRPAVVASPDGSVVVALCVVTDQTTGDIAGVVGRVATRSGTTLTPVTDLQFWPVSATVPGIHPRYFDGADMALLPVMLTNALLYTPAQPNMSNQMIPGGACWPVSLLSGIGATPGTTNGLAWADRIDDTHMGYQVRGGGSFPYLGLATVNPSTGVVSLGATVRTDHGDGIAPPLRQEPGRPGWYRGYRYGTWSGPYDDPLAQQHAYEFHLDPSAGTATGGEVAAFLTWTVANAANLGYDFDEFGVDDHAAMEAFGLGDFGGLNDHLFVYEWPHRYRHLPTLLPATYVHPTYGNYRIERYRYDSVFSLGNGRLLVLSRITDTPDGQHLDVYRMRVANPIALSGWLIGAVGF